MLKPEYKKYIRFIISILYEIHISTFNRGVISKAIFEYRKYNKNILSLNVFFKFDHNYTFEDIKWGLLTIKTTGQRAVRTKNGNVNFDDKKINRRILLFIATKKIKYVFTDVRNRKYIIYILIILNFSGT